jgi:hypothetical protein
MPDCFYVYPTISTDPGHNIPLCDINGDLTPEWGMHLIDVNVAMGDLVSLARSEGKAFRRR